jgi:cytoskeletal protein RodZ
MHFGERLRQQRLARGLDLSLVSEQTRISKRYLEAIEKGNWKHLPGSVFARSFARQYAEQVGLDPASIEAEVISIFQLEDNLPIVEDNQSRIPAHGFFLRVLESQLWNRVPKSALSLVGALALCSALYMGWQRLILGPAAAADAARELASGMPATKLPADSAGTAGNDSPRGAGVVPASMRDNSGAADGVQQSRQTQIELRAPGAAGNGMAVRIVASQETWVSITANEKKLYSGTLLPNETRIIAGVERAQIVVGNAGGVEVTTDGRSIGPIGPAGQVRVVKLTPSGPQIMRSSELNQNTSNTPGSAEPAKETSSKT